MIPSLADYATFEDSAYPNLWGDCVIARYPGLIGAGARVPDFVNGDTNLITSYVASRWEAETGGYRYVQPENTNNTILIAAPYIDFHLHAYCIWVRSTGQTATRHVMSNGAAGVSVRIYITTDGKINVSWANGARILSSTTTDTTNVWRHVVVQRSRGNNVVQLWIDGVMEASSTLTTTVTTLEGPTTIGGRTDGGIVSTPFGGSWDDFRVYHRMLAPDEIKLLASQRGVSYIRR